MRVYFISIRYVENYYLNTLNSFSENLVHNFFRHLIGNSIIVVLVERMVVTAKNVFMS